MQEVWPGVRGVGVGRAAALLIAASIGGLWFLLAGHSLWEFILLAAPLALIAIVVLFRQHSHSRAERRLWAALDAYAEQERAKRTYSRRNFHARPQTQDR